MSKFVTTRDELFFQSINSELINDVIETSIIIYKPSIENSDPNDIFEESINKVWKVGIQLNCLINRSDQTSNTSEVGTNISQDIKFAINREYIKEKNIYPEIGDIVSYDSKYYEISNVIENQYIAGRGSINWSIILEAHLTNKSILNIEEVNL